MSKKTPLQKNDLTLKIDRAVANALGIDEKTELEMVVVNDMLIVKSKCKKSIEKQKEMLKDRTNRLMDKYKPLLKKLSNCCLF